MSIKNSESGEFKPIGVAQAAEQVDNILEERGKNYGDFDSNAQVSQQIKKAYNHTNRYHRLDPDMKEALEMVAIKLARIINGDPYYKDSWTDIIGYVRLVEEKLS